MAIASAARDPSLPFATSEPFGSVAHAIAPAGLALAEPLSGYKRSGQKAHRTERTLLVQSALLAPLVAQLLLDQ